MKNSKSVFKDKKTSSGERTLTSEVLYQKMGDRWFAFSLIDDEIFMGSISQDEIEGNRSQELKSKSGRN